MPLYWSTTTTTDDKGIVLHCLVLFSTALYASPPPPLPEAARVCVQVWPFTIGSSSTCSILNLPQFTKSFHALQIILLHLPMLYSLLHPKVFTTLYNLCQSLRSTQCEFPQQAGSSV